MVPAEPAARVDQVGSAQQRQHPGIGGAVRAASRRGQPRAVPGELLAEEQACGGQGEKRTGLRVGDPRRTVPEGGGGGRRQRAAASGARGAHRQRGVQGRRRRRQGRRLRRPRRSAVAHDRGHVFRRAELCARQPAALRRYRLDVPVHAQSRRQAGHGQGASGTADDAHRGGRQGPRRDRGNGPCARCRAHDRQQPDAVPVQARRRPDAGGGGRLHAERTLVPRRRVRHPERGPREAGAVAQGSRLVGVGRVERAICEDARPRRAADRLRAQLVADAG